MELLHSGKVRDVYADGDDLILVASDRVSVYDVVLPTPIPDKGKLLTALSLWWFEQLADIVPNHVISATDVPAEFAGRAIRVRRLEMVQVECIARGYLTGLGLKEYERDGTVSGLELPRGLVEASILPEPIFTPTTKAPLGEHDEFITFDDVVAKVGAGDRRAAAADHHRRLLPGRRARRRARASWWPTPSWSSAGRRTAPWSSPTRCSPPTRRASGPPSRTSRAGGSSPSTSSIVRDWAVSTGWDKQAPAPELPEDVVAATRARYVDVYERLTGRQW